jgi:hypothetical protein
MKKIIISCLFCFVTVYISGQDVCWYLSDQKICHEVSATRFLLQSATSDITDIENALQNPVAGSLKKVYDLGFSLFCFEMENTGKENLLALRRELNAREDVIYTSAFFVDKSGGPSSYTNVVIVRLKSKDNYPVLQEYAETYLVKDIRRLFEDDELAYMLTLPHNPEKDAVEIALELYETGLFLSAGPNVLTLCPFESCIFEEEGNMNVVIEEPLTVCYPNPVSDILYVDAERIQNKTSESYDIRLYNSLGAMCRQEKAIGGTVEISVSNLPGGIYFLVIRHGNAPRPEVHKIIVKH